MIRVNRFFLHLVSVGTKLFSIWTFSFTNFFRYEPFPLRISAYELFAYELFPLRTFSVTNFFRYEHFTYEPYPIRTFYISNYSRYEPYPIRTLSHTNLCLRTLAYEPFLIRTLCLRASVLEALWGVKEVSLSIVNYVRWYVRTFR